MDTRNPAPAAHRAPPGSFPAAFRAHRAPPGSSPAAARDHRATALARRGPRAARIGTATLLPLALVLGACAADESTGLWIQDNVAPQPPNCTVEPRATNIRTNGWLDIYHPDGDAGTEIFLRSYWMFPRLLNNLLDAQRMPTYRIDEKGMNFVTNSFRIQVIGYNACVSLPQSDDPFRHCEQISDAISYFVPADVGVIQNTPSVHSVEILPVDVLRTFFGSDLAGVTRTGVTVEVRFRALGIQENGTRVTSNEYHYPITVCRGCLQCPAGTDPVADSICLPQLDVYPECE